MFATLRNYLPFLNMNVLYDNSRLRQELGDAFPPLPRLSTYLGDLLTLIDQGLHHHHERLAQAHA